MTCADRRAIGFLAYLVAMFGGVLIANYLNWPWYLWFIPAIPAVAILVLTDRWCNR